MEGFKVLDVSSVENSGFAAIQRRDKDDGLIIFFLC